MEKRFLISDVERTKYIILGNYSKIGLIQEIAQLGDNLILIEDRKSTTMSEKVKGEWAEEAVYKI